MFHTCTIYLYINMTFIKTLALNQTILRSKDMTVFFFFFIKPCYKLSNKQGNKKDGIVSV